jgi:regulator of replication initiation timing
MKPFKIPRNKDEQIKDIKKRIQDCILERTTLRMELQDLENDYDSSDDTIKT